MQNQGIFFKYPKEGIPPRAVEFKFNENGYLFEICGQIYSRIQYLQTETFRFIQLGRSLYFITNILQILYSPPSNISV